MEYGNKRFVVVQAPIILHTEENTYIAFLLALYCFFSDDLTVRKFNAA